VSAHVVPKAKPFPEDDEQDEKTTVESGWEDEASTTVEQGEVAEKIRDLVEQPRRPATGLTNTGNSSVDESTVDDQRANSQIAALTPGLIGRLVITQGNDVGQEFEMRPGKSYTIGRAIDNDVVLTDIAVSRKHFDLRFEDNAWVIVDRGSGNGTVVNGNLEDNPFMLAHGDSIEIGNTVFRFDAPDAQPRRVSSYDDDEEMSTVAGKPMRSETPEPVAPRPERPKTLPPPTPIRPRSPSSFPVPAAAAPQPASTMPLPQMAARAPMPGVAPTMLGADPMPQAMGMPQPFAAPPAATRPPMPVGYPQFADMAPHNGMPIMISPNGQRGDASTAHVAPTPYSMPVSMPPHAMPRFATVPFSKRTKMILGGVGLALLAGITTIAIVSSGGSPKAKGTMPSTGSGMAKAAEPGQPVVTPLPDPPKQVVPPPKQDLAVVAPPKQDPPKQDPPKQDPPKKDPPKVVVVTPPPHQDPPHQDPPKKDPPKQVARVVTPPHQDPPHQDPPKKDPPKQDPPKKDPPKRVAVADTGEARTKADALYRAKRFSEAANVLATAAKSADDSDARELRHIADLYVKVGRGLSSGTAPAAKPTEAFPTLRQTENLDRAAGGAFSSTIEEALAKVAPKAATAFMADKNYEQARAAVLEAEKLGSGSSGTNMVKQALERAAANLYAEASKEANDNPSEAKEKCKRILNFADSKSPWYAKAAKLQASL
jgi:pSer/pThr/pTyr-binding forkhead associated (FHA) protein